MSARKAKDVDEEPWTRRIVSGASRRPEGAANDPLDDAFYRVRSSACLPPARGWENGRNGVSPPPLVAAGDAPEADEETNDDPTGNRTRDVAVREDEDDPPESYTVSGAGLRRVNGEYVRDGTFQGAHLFQWHVERSAQKRLHALPLE